MAQLGSIARDEEQFSQLLTLLCIESVQLITQTVENAVFVAAVATLQERARHLQEVTSSDPQYIALMEEIKQAKQEIAASLQDIAPQIATLSFFYEKGVQFLRFDRAEEQRQLQELVRRRINAIDHIDEDKLFLPLLQNQINQAEQIIAQLNHLTAGLRNQLKEEKSIERSQNTQDCYNLIWATKADLISTALSKALFTLAKKNPDTQKLYEEIYKQKRALLHEEASFYTPDQLDERARLGTLNHLLDDLNLDLDEIVIGLIDHALCNNTLTKDEIHNFSRLDTYLYLQRSSSENSSQIIEKKEQSRRNRNTITQKLTEVFNKELNHLNKFEELAAFIKENCTPKEPSQVAATGAVSETLLPRVEPVRPQSQLPKAPVNSSAASWSWTQWLENLWQGVKEIWQEVVRFFTCFNGR